jgi:hypothetical protein
MRARTLTITLVLAVVVTAASCKGGGPDWTRKSWKFSRDAGLPSTGWIEFEPEGRKNAVRVVDFSCSSEPRCRFEGTFEATEGSIALHVHPWENASFEVRVAERAMEWTQNGVVVERFTWEPSPRLAPSEQSDDLPIRCGSDADCPKILACGPCTPNAPITSRHAMIECMVNPCPGHTAYCMPDGTCGVRP